MANRLGVWLAASTSTFIALLAAVPAQAADVWVSSPWVAVTAKTTMPAEAPKTMTITATRGGIGTGMVVVSEKIPLQSLAAMLTEFKGEGGRVIPKSAVQVRYPTRRRDCGPEVKEHALELGTQFDAIAPSLVPGEMVQPVLVTVDVPAATPAGTYTASLSVGGKSVPVELRVGAFVVPPAEQRLLYVELVQSPESLARRYNVAMWSDAHFALIEESLKNAGRIGANIMHVPVIPRTYYGHETGMITLRRSGSTLAPDFTVFDRYLALWTKYCGRPRFVQVGLWEMYMRGKGKDAEPPATVEMTLRTNTGLDKVQVSNPEASTVEQPWKAIVLGVQERLTKAGIDKRAMVIGQMNDTHSGEAAVAFFRKIDPDLKWSAWTHGYGYITERAKDQSKALTMRTEEGAIVGFVRAPDTTPQPGLGLGRWAPQQPSELIYINSLRSFLNDSFERQPLIEWRLAPDFSADRHKQGAHTGYGPIGLDYILVPPVAGAQSKNWTSAWVVLIRVFVTPGSTAGSPA